MFVYNFSLLNMLNITKISDCDVALNELNAL